MTDIALQRLFAHRLVGSAATSPVEVVGLFGAVQAQDYGGATWGIAQRTLGAPRAGIDRLFDSGEILRTHVLRPTWHFVLPQDVTWLLELTGRRVLRSAAGRHRQLGIDDGEIDRATEAMCGGLAGNRFLTRLELADVLRGAGISPDGQRLAHFLMAAELTARIISGPRRGKQFTYALLQERAGSAISLSRGEALAELARRYFRGHGPAQLQDFVWWSGLSIGETRSGVALAGTSLQQTDIDGKTYWYDPEVVSANPLVPIAHLLPNFDEFTVGYRDRNALIDRARRPDTSLFSFGSILSNVLTIRGQVRGSWRRTLQSRRVKVDVRLPHRLIEGELAAVETTAEKYAGFLALPVDLTFSDT